MVMLLPQGTLTANAAEGDRTIYLYHTHTGETGRFTFKRNGQYDQRVLNDLNRFLADWRTKQQTKMDPALFDLLWTVYQEVGATQPIHIVSSYRAPATNAMLRKHSKGVAEHSQHTKGKAIDFFIPGIKLTTLREAVMRHQVGGIGYYPTSGSPFVHADTGHVRAWPRMTRAQLKKIFPDGRTLHLPTDGKPLSQEGRAYAQAEWNKCHAVPCRGNPVFGGEVTMLASLEEQAPIPAVRPRTLMSGAFGDAAAVAPQAEIQLASVGGDPTQRLVPTVPIAAPLPALRASMQPGGVTAEGAPIPARKSQRIVVATLNTPPTLTGGSAVAALDELGRPLPQARVLMTPKPQVLTAYVGEPDPEAQRAIEMIIARETTASVAAGGMTAIMQPEQTLKPRIETASLGATDETLEALGGMFDRTFSALSRSPAPAPVATALADLAASRVPDTSIETHAVELVAPELDHVNETLVMPVLMSAEHFAVLTEAEGYLDKATELGPLTGRLGFEPEPATAPVYDRFVVTAPLLLASR